MTKRIILIAVLLVFLTAVLYLPIKFCIAVLGVMPPSKNDMEKVYHANEAELTSITDFLQENQCADIRIELFEDTIKMICYDQNDQDERYKTVVEFSDSKIFNDLEKLKKRGFIRVLKEYNYIFFQKWGSFGESMGLMYCSDKEPDVSAINAYYKVAEKIGQTNWYYYDEKFE